MSLDNSRSEQKAEEDDDLLSAEETLEELPTQEEFGAVLNGE